jgi:cell division protease FtsH
LSSTVDFAAIAKITPGFTGADLANLMNESALLAARRHKEKIGQDEVEEAMERVIAGPERKSRVITEKERRVIAFHESGHALVGHVLENSDPVHKISIMSRGQALGYTMQMPEEDHFLETRDGMLDQIAVLLAGRTAEELFCDDITTGASNDLERATKLAREMVTRYGMSEELGTQVFGEAQHEVFLGRDYASTTTTRPRPPSASTTRSSASCARPTPAPARSWRPGARRWRPWPRSCSSARPSRARP